MSELDAIELRRVLSHFATGVAVVATRHVGGGACGLTANAFTSVSLSPPLVLVCLDRGSGTFGCVRANGSFAVSFLAADQHALSVRFAERRDDKFDGVAYRETPNGSPVVDGAVGWLACQVDQQHPGGDHEIVVARVLDGGSANRLPLVFFRGGYGTVATPILDDEDAVEPHAGRDLSAERALANPALQEELAGELGDG